jgi:hypothetical protein
VGSKVKGREPYSFCETSVKPRLGSNSALGIPVAPGKLRLPMKTRLLLCSLVLTFIAVAQPAVAAPLVVPADGNKIDPLDQPAGPPATHMAVGLARPGSAGFAPNVNVMVQAYADTMDAYIALSKTQFTQMEAKLSLDKKLSDKEWVVEYTGKLPQGELHFYARAVAVPGKVYLITATDTPAAWEKNGAALKKCVDSFVLAK